MRGLRELFVVLSVPVLSCLFIHAQAQSLRELAGNRHRLIGTAARASQLTESQYAATLAREFNVLEPEDELKWEVLRPTPDVFDFTAADRLVDFASSHSLKVRGHTLVWDRQVPPWLKGYDGTSQQLRALLSQHIQTVVSHYQGQVFAWDVVNEAFDDNGRLRSTLWYDKPGIGGSGTDYIEQALRWARAADHQAILFLNEGGADLLNAKSDALYATACDFRRRNVPLDGVGLQMHLFHPEADFASIAANIHRFAALGLQVHITEMDVAVAVDPNGRPRDRATLQQQADVYGRIAAICFAEPQCTLLQTWGFTDRYSWMRSTTHGEKGAALLFDADYQAKPAYFAVRMKLAEVPQRTPRH
jgi:endo-1,4-beta-xylanase